MDAYPGSNRAIRWQPLAASSRLGVGRSRCPGVGPLARRISERDRCPRASLALDEIVEW